MEEEDLDEEESWLDEDSLAIIELDAWLDTETALDLLEALLPGPPQAVKRLINTNALDVSRSFGADKLMGALNIEIPV
jgi:hypothetical protein